MLDLKRLNLTSPHPIWEAAGVNPVSAAKTTVVSWLLLNVYKTGERLHKMKKAKTPQCQICSAPVESQIHFALQCSGLTEIRSQYMEKFMEACPNLAQYTSNPKMLFLALLDPFSSLLPENIKLSWKNSEMAYQLSRNYFFDLHKKREKIIERTSNEQTLPEKKDITQIIIYVYEHI